MQRIGNRVRLAGGLVGLLLCGCNDGSLSAGTSSSEPSSTPSESDAESNNRPNRLSCSDISSLNYELADVGGDPDPRSAAAEGFGGLVDLLPDEQAEMLNSVEEEGTRRYGLRRDGMLHAIVRIVQTRDGGWLVSEVEACDE